MKIYTRYIVSLVFNSCACLFFFDSLFFLFCAVLSRALLPSSCFFLLSIRLSPPTKLRSNTQAIIFCLFFGAMAPKTTKKGKNLRWSKKWREKKEKKKVKQQQYSLHAGTPLPLFIPASA